MRVTFNSQFADAIAAINRTAERLLDRQREVATGTRVHRPSDDPAAAAAVVAERTESRLLDQYVRTTDSVEARLTVVDGVLTDVIGAITEAQTHAAAGRNSFLSQERREAIALALEGVRDSIFSAVNTSIRGAYLFSGAAATTAPYAKTPAISAYQGDANAVRVDVSRGVSVQVTFDGEAVLRGSDPDDLFTVLTTLATSVRAGDLAAVDQGIDALSRALDRVATVQSGVGADLATLVTQRGQIGEMRRASETRRSALQDADLVEAISGLNGARTAHEAALRALSAGSRLSLLDFIR